MIMDNNITNQIWTISQDQVQNISFNVGRDINQLEKIAGEN